MSQWLPDLTQVADAPAESEPAPAESEPASAEAEPAAAEPASEPEPSAPVPPTLTAPATATLTAPATATLAAPATHHHRPAAAVALLGLIVLAALLLFAFGSPTGEAPPATGAAQLVPADALVYVHVSTDPRRTAVRRAMALLARLPDRGAGITGLAQRIVAEVGGSPSTSFARDIRPWLGSEAAFAILNSSGASAGSLVVLRLGDTGRAHAFITHAGAQPAGHYRGNALFAYPTGAELAFVKGYLVVGQDEGVRAAIDAAAGRVRVLAHNPLYERAIKTEPATRILDAYASAAGVTRVLDARGGLLGALGTLLAEPGLQASALSVSAAPPGLAIQIHDVLRAATGRTSPFTPSLQSVLPAGTTLMLDARDLATAAPPVMRAMTRIGLYAFIPDLLRRVGAALAAEGYDVRPVLRLFAGETAVALASGQGARALVIVTRTSHPAAALSTLAGLEPPLIQLFTEADASAGIEPTFADVQTNGVKAHQLELAPGLEFDYAVFNHLVVVSTSLRGIGDIAARTRALGSSSGYRTVLGHLPTNVTSLGFADFSQLLTLGEQSSLARSATFRELQADLRTMRTVGMYSTRGESDTTTEAFFQIP